MQLSWINYILTGHMQEDYIDRLEKKWLSFIEFQNVSDMATQKNQ